LVFAFGIFSPAQSPQPKQHASAGHPVRVSVYDRTRLDAWQWFAAPPDQATYGYAELLLRLGVSQRIQKWDWQLELWQSAVLGLPDDSVSPVTAQGQLGLGGTYYASNGNNIDPAALFSLSLAWILKYAQDLPASALGVGAGASR
jgi:hypothetical protein